MPKARLGVRLDAKTHGEIHAQWKAVFYGKFRHDRTACFTELYYAGKSYERTAPDGPHAFATIQSAFVNNYVQKSKKPIRVRLNLGEQRHVCQRNGHDIPIGRQNRDAASNTVASYVILGYRHVNGYLHRHARDGDVL